MLDEAADGALTAVEGARVTPGAISALTGLVELAAVPAADPWGLVAVRVAVEIDPCVELARLRTLEDTAPVLPARVAVTADDAAEGAAADTAGTAPSAGVFEDSGASALSTPVDVCGWGSGAGGAMMSAAGST